MNISTKQFYELTLNELYAILALRNRVFVVEQQSIYNDTDGLDQAATHMLGHDKDILVGYARVLPPDTKYKDPSFGRFLIAKSARKSGLGRLLLSQVIQYMKTTFPNQPIRIEAQSYLKTFYESNGFKSIGEVYDLDGIQHVEMLKSK
jgi:ElaA protein